MAAYILDQIGKFCLLDENEEVKKPTTRTAHMYAITAYATLLFFVLSRVPLVAPQSMVSEGTMTFRKSGTLMTLGTQPFVLTNMICGIVDKSISNQAQLAAGLLLSIFQSYMASDSMLDLLQLLVVSWTLMNAIDYTDKYGAIGITSSLIFVNGSLRILQSEADALLWTIVCIGVLCYINQMYLPIRLTHTKSRQDTSGKLNLMYNGTTPLIIYYTLEEWFTYVTAYSIPILCLFPVVYYLTLEWPQLSENTGYNVMRKYKEQDLVLKGWRSTSAMGHHINNQVNRLSILNAYILLGMAATTIFVRPSVSCGTLLIIVQVAKEIEPTHQLQKRLRPLLRWL